MPLNLSPLELAEAAIWIAGTLVIATIAVRLCIRKTWRDAFRLPLDQRHHIQPTDILLALCVFLVLPSLFYSLLAPSAASTQTASPTSAPIFHTGTDPWRVLATAAAQVTAAVVFVLIGRTRFQQGLAGWGLSGRRFGANAIRAIVAYVALWPVCSGLLLLTTWLLSFVPGYVPIEHDALLALHDPANPTWVVILIVISAVVLAPIVEELLFRGLIQPALAQRMESPWGAVCLTGLAFGIIHVPLYQTVPALILFGIILGYAYAKTQSLSLVILIHAIFNAKTILWSLLGPAVGRLHQ